MASRDNICKALTAFFFAILLSNNARLSRPHNSWSEVPQSLLCAAALTAATATSTRANGERKPIPLDLELLEQASNLFDRMLHMHFEVESERDAIRYLLEFAAPDASAAGLDNSDMNDLNIAFIADKFIKTATAALVANETALKRKQQQQENFMLSNATDLETYIVQKRKSRAHFDTVAEAYWLYSQLYKSLDGYRKRALDAAFTADSWGA